MAETSGGLIRGSAQWTPEQHAWLEAESTRLGLGSVAAVARFYVQAAIQAQQGACRECPIHCKEAEA